MIALADGRKSSKVLPAVTLATLAIPYLIFFLGWLRWEYGCILALGMVGSIYLTLRHDPGIGVQLPPWRGNRGTYVLTLVLVLEWVALSGAGGFSYQSFDYHLHNGRLKDLIDYPWPVIYPGHKPLVYYNAYYLPNALIGSFIGFSAAYRLMFLWTAFLVLLASLWSFAAIGRANTWIIVAFIFFSGMDVLGAVFLGFNSDPVNHVEWWTFKSLYLAYQSVTFQLFWSPHQVIASWILTAMITVAAINHSARSVAFIASLACFWAPFAALVLTLLVVVSFLARGTVVGVGTALGEILSLQNLYGGVIIPSLFLVYYASGSIASNPSGWLWDRVDFSDLSNVVRLVLFYLLEFGVIAALCFKHIGSMPPSVRALVLTALVLLLIIPVWYYGFWNDFVARGAVPCLWLLFFLVQSFLFSAEARRPEMYPLRMAVLIVLAIGALTPAVSFREALMRRETRKPVSVPDYQYASLFLGSTDSFFFRHLASRRRVEVQNEDLHGDVK